MIDINKLKEERGYSWISDLFFEGLAMVTKDGKYGYINEEGEEVIPCKHNEAWDFSEGLAKVKKDGKWGYINKEGEEVIPCKYDSVGDFSEGLAEVKKDGKEFKIDRFENAYYTEQEIEMFEKANESIQGMKNEAIKAIENATLEEAERMKEELAQGIQTKRAELAEGIKQFREEKNREEQEKTAKKKIIEDIQSL